MTPSHPLAVLRDSDNAGALLDAAESADPYSDFVEGVRDWHELNGFITQRQADTLWRIVRER